MKIFWQNAVQFGSPILQKGLDVSKKSSFFERVKMESICKKNIQSFTHGANNIFKAFLTEQISAFFAFTNLVFCGLSANKNSHFIMF